MEMRIVGTTGRADRCEWLALGDSVSHLDPERTLPQMAQKAEFAIQMIDHDIVAVKAHRILGK
jgi:hypothetical protein